MPVKSMPSDTTFPIKRKRGRPRKSSVLYAADCLDTSQLSAIHMDGIDTLKLLVGRGGQIISYSVKRTYSRFDEFSKSCSKSVGDWLDTSQLTAIRVDGIHTLKLLVGRGGNDFITIEVLRTLPRSDEE